MMTVTQRQQVTLFVFSVCLLLLFPLQQLNAQTMHFIGHASGSVNYGNTIVTVTNGNTAGIGCYKSGQPPGYLINSTNTPVTVSFNKPTNHVRTAISVANEFDSVYFAINGQHYPLKLSNLSAPTFSTCNCLVYTPFYINASGDLVDTMTSAEHGGTHGCIMVDIWYPNIQSFSIHTPSMSYNLINTTAHEVYFEEDTTSFITQPFTDTLFCPGDSLYLKYTTNFDFKTGNSFTAQLSDANGGWSSPVNIGSLSAVKAGTVPCLIPRNAAAGSGYRIRLVGSNPKDTSLDNQVNIRIKAGPVAFSNTTATPACTGDTLYLTGSSTTTGLTWTWTGPNGFTSSKEDTFIANPTTAHAGKYVVTANLGLSNCSLSDTVDVVMKQSPNKPTASSNNPVCETKTLQLNGSSTTTGVSYAWAGPAGYSSSTQNPTVSNNSTLAMSGDYILSTTKDGCLRKDTVAVAVIKKPVKPTASAPNSPLCIHQDLQLNAFSTTGGVNYQWYGAAGFTANTQNPVRQDAQPAHAGTYYVYAELTGCASDTESVTVVVNTNPIVNIFPTPGVSICKGEQAIFTAIPTNGGTNPAYLWFLNGSNTGVTTKSYSTTSLNNGDNVYCLMTSTGTCATPFTDTSNELPMTVLEKKAPQVSVNASAGPSLYPNEPIVFTATATDAGTNPAYQWQRNGVDINGANGFTWGANANALSSGDVICAIVTSNYECPEPATAKSNCITVQIKVGVDDVNGTSQIKVYPNPVGDVLNITSPGLSKGEELIIIELYDIVGRKMPVAYSNGSINMSGLPAGNYVLQVQIEGGVREYFKVVKE